MDKNSWIHNYPKSIQYGLDFEKCGSVVNILDDVFERYKDLPMVENMGRVLSYCDVDTLSRNFAAYLQNHTSLKPGDHIAIQMPNLLQYTVAMIGVIRAGMIVVNVNPLYTSYEMEFQLKDAKAKAIVILSNFAHNLEKVLDSTSIHTIITTNVGDLLGGIRKHVVNFFTKYVKKLVPEYVLPNEISFNKVLQIGKRSAFVKIEPLKTDTAAIQYTGGTTGISKGAMLTHYNIASNIEQMKTWLCARLTESKEILINPLPLYHIFSFTVNLTMMSIGACSVLITNPRNINNVISVLRKHKFTCFVGVNVLYNTLLSHKKFLKLNFSSLKASMSGGTALHDIVAKRWEKVTGTPLVEAYGLTEASPGVICGAVDGTHRIGTVGVPIPGTSVKILDDNGNEVNCNMPGSLFIKGPQVMKGYWQQPEETTKVFKDGWLETGDIALMDKDGFFKIVDRKKEIIDVSGFNVYPSEIEKVVSSHHKVQEVGVIGVPYKNCNEAIKLYIVKRDQSLSKEEIIEYCKERLTKYKVPKFVEFRESLPKSNVGKVLHRILKEELMRS